MARTGILGREAGLHKLDTILVCRVIYVLQAFLEHANLTSFSRSCLCSAQQVMKLNSQSSLEKMEKADLAFLSSANLESFLEHWRASQVVVLLHL